MQVILSLGLGDTSSTLNVFYILLQTTSTFSLDFEAVTIDAVVGGESSLYSLSLSSGSQKVSLRGRGRKTEGGKE